MGWRELNAHIGNLLEYHVPEELTKIIIDYVKSPYAGKQWLARTHSANRLDPTYLFRCLHYVQDKVYVMCFKENRLFRVDLESGNIIQQWQDEYPTFLAAYSLSENLIIGHYPDSGRICIFALDSDEVIVKNLNHPFQIEDGDTFIVSEGHLIIISSRNCLFIYDNVESRLVTDDWEPRIIDKTEYDAPVLSYTNDRHSLIWRGSYRNITMKDIDFKTWELTVIGEIELFEDRPLNVLWSDGGELIVKSLKSKGLRTAVYIWDSQLQQFHRAASFRTNRYAIPLGDELVVIGDEICDYQGKVVSTLDAELSAISLTPYGSIISFDGQRGNICEYDPFD